MINPLTDIDKKLLQEKYPDQMEFVNQKLAENYPVQYLIGNVNFYGYQINVDERVLIPRFETEMLVEETIKLIKLYIKEPHILDIGTGSGCIAISLSKELNTTIDAIDISKNALEVATENAVLNHANVNFYNLDITNCDLKSTYNVIISNPPYVSFDEEVDPSTKYEPQIALYANNHGLAFYEIILKQAHQVLTKPSLIAFEIGASQKDDLIDMAKTIYPHALITIKNDLQNRPRYCFIVNE